MKKKHKRKYKHKKQISAEEKERRRQLAEKRKERQKREKRQLTAELITGTFIGIIFLAVIILSAIFKPDFLLIFYTVVSAAAILLFDQSGIRSFIFRWYPDNFIFADELKSHDTERSVPMQLAGTVNWTMFMLIILDFEFESGLRCICTIIWLISIGVGLYYMLTTEEYSLEKGAKYECSALYLLITPIYVLLMGIYNVRITAPFIAFTAIFIVIYNIMYAVMIHNGNQVYTRLIYGIIVSAFCASSGFLLINKTLDFSEPHEYRLTVEDKDYSGGKSTTYYIYTQDWSNPTELIDIRVNSDVYRSLEEGDSVIIETKSGSLGMEHYGYKEKAPV